MINARGHSTTLGASLMSEGVWSAMRQAGTRFGWLSDLQAAAGRVISAATGSEAGYVTSGTAAALTLSTAACLTGENISRVKDLPDRHDGRPNDILLLRAHRSPYVRLLRLAGANPVEIGEASGVPETALRDAVTPRTAAIFYDASKERAGGFSIEQVVAIAHEVDVPVIVDAALALPPATNLRRYVSAGADLVCYSGGKAIRGPSASGFIACKVAYLKPLAMNHQELDEEPEYWTAHRFDAELAPHLGVGRGMKVGKEEIAGLTRAIEEYVVRDHAREAERWQSHINRLGQSLSAVSGLTTTITSLDDRPVPLLRVEVDADHFGMTAVGLVLALRAGSPMIVVDHFSAADGIVRLNPENLAADQITSIIEAFVRIGSQAKSTPGRRIEGSS